MNLLTAIESAFEEVVLIFPTIQMILSNWIDWILNGQNWQFSVWIILQHYRIEGYGFKRSNFHFDGHSYCLNLLRKQKLITFITVHIEIVRLKIQLNCHNSEKYNNLKYWTVFDDEMIFIVTWSKKNGFEKCRSYFNDQKCYLKLSAVYWKMLFRKQGLGSNHKKKWNIWILNTEKSKFILYMKMNKK